MLAVANSSARNTIPDPRYATFDRVLRRARDGNLASARVLDLDSVANATKSELETIKSLLENNLKLDAELAELASKLEIRFAALPTIVVKARQVDHDNKPTGEEYTIRSDYGVIDFVYQRLTSQEFLLIMQSEGYQSGRAFVAGSDYDCDRGILCRRQFWPSGRVRYFFDTGLSSAEKRWMRNAMDKITRNTGMRFREITNTGWVRFWHTLGLSDDLKISKGYVGGGAAGEATVGRVGKSYLTMTPRYVRDEEIFTHEVGHVFGLLHEHQRYDRNSYVISSRRGSDYDPISPRNCYWFAFWRWCKTNSTTYSTPYDYHSIMHYPASLGFTARSTRRSWEANNRDTFTDWDVYAVKRLYGMSPNPRPSNRPQP